MSKYRKMLNDWEAPYLQAIIKQVETQSKSTLAHWVAEYAESMMLPIWEKHYPEDPRPRNAVAAARQWLAGEIKLPQAKALILECHSSAREAEGTPAACAAARAVGQSASVIHSARHCIGLPLYGALAAAYDALGPDAPWADLSQYAAGECERMLQALKDRSVEHEPDPVRIDWKC